MRGLTSTLLLVLVLAGLGAYIYFVESKRPASGIEEKDKVFAVEAEAIEELTVTAQGETTTLRKSDGNWKIVAPITADADQNEASNIASAIAGLEINRVVEENAGNLADYGLAQPGLKVAFKGPNAGGEVHFGSKNPTESDLYAVKAGEKRVFLVSAFQESTLAKNTFALRDKRVLQFDRDKVDTIELTAPGSETILLARSGTDWQLKAPIQARGDYSTIEALLTRLSTVAMSKLIDPNSPESFGLETPAAVVTLGAGSTRATLELGAEKEGEVFARDRARQLMFTVPADLLTDLKKNVADVRDKDLFEARTFNANKLQIQRGGQSFEFQKVSGGQNASDKWQRVVDGKATDVDATKMDDFLSKLTALRAQSFNPTTNAAGQEPAMVVSFTFDNDKTERVRFIKSDADAFGVREGEAGVAVLDASAYDETINALEALIA